MEDAALFESKALQFQSIPSFRNDMIQQELKLQSILSPLALNEIVKYYTSLLLLMPFCAK